MKLIKTAFTIIFVLFVSLTARLNAEENADTQAVQAYKPKAFYMLAIKFGIGCFNPKVSVDQGNRFNVLSAGIRTAFLGHVDNNTHLGLMMDFLYTKKGFEYSKNLFDMNNGRDYLAVNALMTVKHKSFFFGVGYEVTYVNVKEISSFNSSNFDHFIVISFGQIFDKGVKLFWSFEVKSSLNKLNNYSFNSVMPTEKFNSIEYVLSFGIGI